MTNRKLALREQPLTIYPRPFMNQMWQLCVTAYRETPKGGYTQERDPAQ